MASVTIQPPPRIDVHAHFVPPAYSAACVANGLKYPDGMPAYPEWSVEEHLAMAKDNNITKSILSISSPGTHLKDGDDAFARKLSRECNEHAADIKKKYPDNFGFWASLPLPDVEGSLVELAYALDHLDADGVTLKTNAHGQYLGSAAFEPVMRELDRRKATVFIHPTTPCKHDKNSNQCINAAPLEDFASPMFEFLFDTARAVMNLFLSGTIDRYPNVTWVIPHGGGALAPLLDRFPFFRGVLPNAPIHSSVTPPFVKERLRKQFYFDMAGMSWPNQLKMILPFISTEQILYGSDYPWTPRPAVKMLADVMDKCVVDAFPSEEDRKKIYSENAIKLLSKNTN